MDIKKLIEKQKTYFNTGVTKKYDFRIKSLKKLLAAINKYEEQILLALNKDLNKPKTEAYITEVLPVKMEMKNMLSRLKKYMREKYVSASIINIGSKEYIKSEPYGVVAIISPWNYSINLTFVPLIGAIAAGNCSIIKIDERMINVNKIVKKIINEIYEEEYIFFFEGSGKNAADLIKEQVDYIFFTGSINIGKTIMRSCSDNLIPLTLELGGKSPTIVNDTKNFKAAARKIVYSKFINNGQTCIATDYILLNSKIKKEFILELKRQTEIEFPSETYYNDSTKIFTKSKFISLKNIISSNKVLYGGEIDEDKNLIKPTFIEIDKQTLIKQEEIFGPVLPIIYYDNIEEAVSIVNSLSKALVVYLFSNNKTVVKKVEEYTSSGSFVLNDTVMQIIEGNLPFGGVGSSGFGRYHGEETFNTFSNRKSVMKKKVKSDCIFRYKKYEKVIKKILKKY